MKPIHEFLVEVEEITYHFVLHEREAMDVPPHMRFRVMFINVQGDDEIEGDVWVSIPHEVMEIIREQDHWDIWLTGFKQAVTMLINRELIELKPKT